MFLKCSVERDGQFITPLRMLIEKMPGNRCAFTAWPITHVAYASTSILTDVADTVFTKCLTRNEKSVNYNFEFIEDYRREDVPLTVHTVPNVATALIPIEEKRYSFWWLYDDDEIENSHASPPQRVPSRLKGYISCHPLTLMVGSRC